MTIREVLQYPDARLRAVSLRVPAITEEVCGLASDLVQTMRYGPREGIGLAAPQVGVLLRVFVMEECREKERKRVYVCINPEILKASGSATFREGCLSFPRGSIVKPARAASVRLAYTDTLGAKQERTFSGIMAVCVQHELDHLDGKLMVDYGELRQGEETA